MFTEKEKEIFIIPHTNLGVDPLEVKRRLTLSSKNELHSWIVTFNETQDELEKATVEEKIVAVTRDAFKLKTTAEGGVTDAIVLEYLSHFLEWLSRPLEAKPPNSRPSRPCMGCPPTP